MDPSVPKQPPLRHFRGVNLHPFIFVGCWNETRGGAINPPRNEVLKKIAENPIKHVVIGGDNIYPYKTDVIVAADGKEEKIKKYSRRAFNEGLELFVDLGKKILFSSIGNHNLNKFEDGGSILNAELGNSRWILPSRYYAIKFIDCALIVLDTNIMENDTELGEMIKWLKDILSELGAHPYYIVQHEPYVSFKKKKDQIFVALKNGKKILDAITESATLPLAILCADTHNYQKGKLTVNGKEIVQYVVGTGGAIYDPIPPSVEKGTVVDAGGIQLTYETEGQIKKYGYLQLNAPTDISFEGVLDWEAKAGGARRSTRSNKKSKRFHTRRRH
jgi:hypothetical protein